MIVGMHQPNYIPWIGFFHKMALSDIFVLVDNIQFSNKSFTNRNKIKGPEGEIMLTVPVSKKGFQNINELRISNGSWVRTHIGIIKHAYARTPFFKKYFPLLTDIYTQKYEKLVELNVNLIRWVNYEMNNNVKMILSSELGETFGPKNDLIIDICKRLNATTYLNGLGGSTNYIDEQKLKLAQIQINYQKFSHPVYPQLWGGFIPNLSILDLLFNCGDQSLDIIISC